VITPRAAEKQVTLSRASELVAAWRAAGETVVLARGVFDLLWVRHARYLGAARALGTRLVVAVSSDASAAAPGRPRPVLGAEHRATLVAGLRAVDLVVVLEEGAWRAQVD
jgi:bifunctional ADP-heptose synthase (sugar kinase/adenylyltransferase)